MPEFVNMASPSNLFNVVVFSLSSFVSKFHFNIITGFGVLTIFVYKGLTRNLGIGVFLVTGDCDELGIANFAEIFLIKYCWLLKNFMV